ncbi:MAG: glycosyltransferase [Endomicrobia bacterium]|nr:glycosyltransferase [Endomicrobiia bacterium]MCL2506253.1 glycosyltransferase [Endomicrobiia bacterium]
MSFWKKTGDNSKKTYLLCGIEIFKKRKESDKKAYYFLGIKYWEKKFSFEKTVYFLFGIEIFKKIKEPYNKKYYIFGIKYRQETKILFIKIMPEGYRAQNGKNILLVNHSMTHTGAPIALLRVGEILKENGFNPYFLSPEKGDLEEKVLATGIPVIYCRDIYASGQSVDLKTDFSAALCNTACSLFPYDNICRTMPTMLWLHELVSEDLPEKESDILNQATNVYAGGPLVNKFLEFYGQNGKVLLYPAQDKCITPDFNRNESETVKFSVMGSICKRKNQELFISAIKLIPPDIRKKARFDIVANMTDDVPLLNKLKQNSKNINELSFIPLITDETKYRQYLDSVDAVVCSSTEDPLPIVITDAMMHGKIPIVSSMTGHKEMIENGIDGYVFENGHPQELAKIMQELIEHPASMTAVKQAARDVFLKNFNEAAVKKQIISIINTLTCRIESDKNLKPLVSVIVPNYNHAKYLRKRLDSIYSQTYKNIEVLLLDDFSTDESREILTRYESKYHSNTKIYFNEKNSGGVFYQWKKGLSLAKGDLVWIAESDDYCSDNFLEEAVKFFQYESVKLFFARTIFVNGKNESFCDTERYLRDFKRSWINSEFIETGDNLVRQGFGFMNIVPNVSGAVFRNTGFKNILDDKNWYSLKLCGDWMFYLNLIKEGKVAYSSFATNYYRQLDEGTCKKVAITENFYTEHEQIAVFVAKNYNVRAEIFIRQNKALEHHTKHFKNIFAMNNLSKYYDLKKILNILEKNG